jgi:hypothetical protein
LRKIQYLTPDTKTSNNPVDQKTALYTRKQPCKQKTVLYTRKEVLYTRKQPCTPENSP